MKAFVVRMKSGASYQGPRLVGFFVVPSLARLSELADQVGDPGEMEATEIKLGGVMWTKQFSGSWGPEMDEYSGVPNRDVGLGDPPEDDEDQGEEDDEDQIRWIDLADHPPEWAVLTR